MSLNYEIDSRAISNELMNELTEGGFKEFLRLVQEDEKDPSVVEVIFSYPGLGNLAVSAITLGIFAGCGSSSSTGDATGTDAKIKVGMVTDSGTIDDKSFNQGTWEGIEKAQKDFNLDEPKYLKPTG